MREINWELIFAGIIIIIGFTIIIYSIIDSEIEQDKCKKLVIELDGHESHKTKMQRTKDAQRERYLKKEGWELIRFTGNEIYYDVVRCVQELQEFISNLKKEEVKEDDTKTIK